MSHSMTKIAYVCVRLLKRKAGRLPLLEAITPVDFQPSANGSRVMFPIDSSPCATGITENVDNC